MRKILVLSLMAMLVAGLATTPADARAIKRASLIFNAPMAAGPSVIGLEAPCANTYTEFRDIAYDDVIVRAPRGADLLVVRMYPELDWDLFICRGGKKLTSSEKGLGVDEVAVLRVRPGYAYRIRALNWAGEPEVPGSYAFYNL